MTIYAKPGTEFLATLTDAPQGLLGTLALGVFLEPGLTVLSPYATGGIVEEVSGPATSTYYGVVPAAPDAPAADGTTYVAKWRNGTTIVEEELRVTAVLPETPVPEPFSSTSADRSPQWATYLDVQADFKPWAQVPPEISDRDSVLQLILDTACQWVQNYLSRPIAPTRFERRFNGWSGLNGAYIMLPYAPVLEVSSVTEWWGTSGAHVLEEQTPDHQVDGYQVDHLRGVLTRAFTGLIEKPWFPGSRNIEIAWVAGYNPVPADIRMATLELANYWYRNTQEASRSFRPLAEYDGPSQNGLWPGVPNRIVTLLEPYVQIGIG